MSIRYYALMDPVRLGGSGDEEAHAHRCLTATTRLWLDMLLFGVVPVLSQSQVFDNRLLLDAARMPEGDGMALLSLIAVGRVVPGSSLLGALTHPSRNTVLLAHFEANSTIKTSASPPGPSLLMLMSAQMSRLPCLITARTPGSLLTSKPA